jgi:hypothetical protein
MSDKLLVCALDALDEFNIYQLNLKYIQSLYEERGDIFTASTLPHTALSNPMIFGGIENEDKFWVEREDGKTGEETGQYVDPAQYFDREEGKPVDGAKGFSRAEDYSDESFIWDDLYAAGYNARAVQVPVILPPYSFRASRTLDDAWFPDNKERMAKHVREKPKILKEEFEDGADAVFSSIQMPDKYLHAIGEGKASEKWVLQEAPVFDKRVKQLIEYCESNDIEWMFFGDHGSPHPGAMKKNGYILPRHRKESIIISSDGIEPPTYTDEMYPWLLDYYDVETVGADWSTEFEPEKEIDTSVESRLENLGYL